MDNTLSVFKNTQYNAIPISDFCILEVYKDNLETPIGYTILPIEQYKNRTEIEAAIRAAVAVSAPAGYTRLVILSGNEVQTFSHRIVYCVWVANGVTDLPTYPEEPIVPDIPNVDSSGMLYQTETVTNNCGGPVEAQIILSCVNTEDDVIEFYINDHYFKIAPDVVTGTKYKIKINSSGVYYNNNPIDSFEMDTIPILEVGDNTLIVKRTNVENVSISYKERY